MPIDREVEPVLSLDEQAQADEACALVFPEIKDLAELAPVLRKEFAAIVAAHPSSSTAEHLRMLAQQFGGTVVTYARHEGTLDVT